MSNFVEHKFNDGVLRLEWYNLAQQKTLTPEEATKLAQELLLWSSNFGWVSTHDAKPDLNRAVQVIWLNDGEDVKEDTTLANTWNWYLVGSREQPMQGDVIKWRYAD